jgi:amino acid adenylation domain-containing protein
LTAQVDARIDPDRICAFMQRALEELVTALEEAPQTPVNTIDILPQEERQQLLVEWNDTAAPLSDQCVHELFEVQVQETPEATAVVFEEQTLSYAELNARANQLAHHLIALGVQPDAPIAIALERSPEMIVALLAVLKAGGAYVPLDPEYPVERLAFMLEDSAARILITQTPLREKLPKVEHTICVDTEPSSFAQHPDTNPDQPVRPEHLAYIIYTSGSTGKPKGVALEHRSPSALLDWARSVWSPEELSGVLASTSICFDLSVFEIFLPLSVGGTAILAENALALSNIKSRNRVTLVNTVPSALDVLLRQNGLPTSVRVVNLAGEPLVTELVNRIYEIPSVQKVYDLYGPSEDTTYSTFKLRASKQPPSIGRPIANTQLYVLDRHNQPTPIGVPGELHIGGAGLARGYLNRPELTAERFIPDPFSDVAGARLYKTGDLVRYRQDGNLEFLGRLDHQVKIRGFRIELGEIEAALSAYPAIREAVVIARNDETGDKRLVAYLVPEAGSRELTSILHPTVTDLRTHLKASLPEYMLPAAFVFLDALPLTPNGKVDRKALPKPEGHLDEKLYQCPRDALERQLVQIWESLLSARPIGIADNFFELGGHSLLAVRLIAEIDRRVGKRLPLSRLFEHPTIADLCRLLRQDGKMPEASCLVKIRAKGTQAPLIFLPGAGGLVSYLYPLAQRLDSAIPFLTFQARGLDGKSAPHTSVEAMAEHYVGLLLEVQPIGPYFLGGHSFGGLVAFAMAQLLLAQGQTIGLLAIVDTFAPGAVSDIGDELIADDASLILDIGQLLAQLHSRKMTISREALSNLNTEEQLAFVASLLERENILPQGDGADHLRNLLNVYGTHLQMHRRYLPESTIPMPIVLFRAADTMSGPLLSADLGWSEYSSQEVHVHVVPGDHVTLMTLPQVEKLALVLADCSRRN